MSLSIEIMPDGSDEEVRAWADRFLNEISGEFQALQNEISTLHKDLKKAKESMHFDPTTSKGLPRFNGGKRLIDIPKWAPAGDFIISFFFMLDTEIPHQQAFVSAVDIVDEAIVIDCKTDGTIRFYITSNSGNTTMVETEAKYNDGFRHRLVAQYKDGVAKLTIDGVSPPTKSWGADAARLCTVYTFGAMGRGGDKSISGTMYNVMLQDLSDASNNVHFPLTDGGKGSPVALSNKNFTGIYDGFEKEDFIQINTEELTPV